MPNTSQRIANNVLRIRERIAAAADRAGRKADDVTLVAVTKYVGVEEVRALVEAGCLDIGESRPQELWHKAEALDDDMIRWHLIGHLQRNKVHRTLRHVSLIHSGDSQRLIEAVDAQAVKSSRKCGILLEVNISGDPSKHGFSPEQLKASVAEFEKLRGLCIRGLMAMASFTGGVSQARQDFAQLRELRDEIMMTHSPQLSLDHLSMGMSRDFDAAIEEGATIVRVGSALFE